VKHPIARGTGLAVNPGVSWDAKTTGRGHHDAGHMAQPLDVLIVEDDRETLGGWVQLFDRAGYRVTAAATFDEARAALDGHTDVLVTDLRLGPYNGLQLVMRARAQKPQMPVFVVTGFSDPVLAAEAERLGAIHIEKPVDAEYLIALVGEAAARARQRQG
jgi:DNA-binding NtrC family response regulator